MCDSPSWWWELLPAVSRGADLGVARLNKKQIKVPGFRKFVRRFGGYASKHEALCNGPTATCSDVR